MGRSGRSVKRDDLRVTQPGRREIGSVPDEFLLGGGALQGQHHAARPGQAGTPPGQPAQRSDRPGNHHVCAAGLRRRVLGARPDHQALIQAEPIDDLGQEANPPLKGLEKHDPAVGAGDRQHDTG